MIEGLIVSNVFNLYYVKTPQKTYECIGRGRLKNESIIPVVGDIAKISLLEGSKGVIEEITPRTVYIKRPKIANVNQIIFVLSFKNPKPDLLMLDKQLCFADNLGINSLILLNKVDLGANKDIENIYRSIGYTVIKTNAKEDDLKQKLYPYLKDKITVFAGNSGVGKSTITNNLLKQNSVQIGEISQKNNKGKNTTTTVSLYEIDEDTYIADTPGFSTFDIYEIEPVLLCKHFIEFNKYIPNCEFIGCSHIKEDNCGVKDAVDKGLISSERYERYCKVYEQLRLEEERKW